MNAGLCVPLAGATGCPKPGVAAAAAKVTSKTKFRSCVMLASPSWSRQRVSHNATPSAGTRERDARRPQLAVAGCRPTADPNSDLHCEPDPPTCPAWNHKNYQ